MGDPGQSESTGYDLESAGMSHMGQPSTYMISDKGTVCAIKFLTSPAPYSLRPSAEEGGRGGAVVSGIVRPGEVLRVSFDFGSCQQMSSMVRARLIQKETHVDDTRLQVE